ncbi:ankyrin repeat domain-containing protein [Helicobacter sp. MIT 00-7814]|uniref:ankyrin repeat domain-containing protein n=1 Tax=unclassified Helicobacter TaxID=2593540 RepID=UPI000E1F8F37|nr:MULTISPECIES: ankyrin repeat domain-containing protein [unclassified Helicobacter]RDU56181.1 ankyrin repeat domain-containing protein [Helicobacter sp. MIT 99-10781]RDU56278.1 ankyrin repeat domain-containing protein [Helicobacter sp. MIT 00-7814]
MQKDSKKAQNTQGVQNTQGTRDSTLQDSALQDSVLSDEERQKLEELCAQSFDFARADDVESLKILLDSGLNVNLANEQGNTLIMLAAYNNSLACARLLLERGADVDKRNDKGQTPLAGVCFKGYYEMAKLLIEHGADVDSEGALSPMNCAIIFHRAEILKLLRQHSRKKPSFLQKIGFYFLTKFGKK